MSFNPSWATFGVIDFSRLKGCTFRALAASRCLASLAGLAFATFGRRGRLSLFPQLSLPPFPPFLQVRHTSGWKSTTPGKAQSDIPKLYLTTWNSCKIMIVCLVVHCAGRFFSSASLAMLLSCRGLYPGWKGCHWQNGNLAAQAAQIPLREGQDSTFIIKISDNGITELKLHKLFSHALHL